MGLAVFSALGGRLGGLPKSLHIRMVHGGLVKKVTKDVFKAKVHQGVRKMFPDRRIAAESMSLIVTHFLLRGGLEMWFL